MAGQEGLEPPTRGFGDRCSTIGATDLSLFLFSLFVAAMLSAGWAIFLKFEFAKNTFFWHARAIIFIIAVFALEMYYRSILSHFFKLSTWKNPRAFKNWSPRPDLNRWPLPYQGSALPTELRGHFILQGSIITRQINEEPRLLRRLCLVVTQFKS